MKPDFVVWWLPADSSVEALDVLAHMGGNADKPSWDLWPPYIRSSLKKIREVSKAELIEGCIYCHPSLAESNSVFRHEVSSENLSYLEKARYA